jgi:aminoglycoside phosphotransferase (APT) family kinase protein
MSRHGWRGRLSGVIDWTQASIGTRSVDLGHMRWNLAINYGIEACDEFLARYVREPSASHLRHVARLRELRRPRLESAGRHPAGSM